MTCEYNGTTMGVCFGVGVLVLGFLTDGGAILNDQFPKLLIAEAV